MKNLLALMLVLSSTAAFAVPRANYLAAPESIEVHGDKLALIMELGCSNAKPQDMVGQLVTVSDDEGDQVIGVGVVLSKSACKPGPLQKVRLEFPLSQVGVTQSDIRSGETILMPIDLAE